MNNRTHLKTIILPLPHQKINTAMKFSKLKTNLLLSLFFTVFFSGLLSAQSVVSSTFSSTGAALSNDEYSIHFSMGESLNTVLKEGSMRLSQGIIQYLISDLPSSTANIQLEGLSVYPNPAPEYLIIDNKQALQNLQYALYSLDGKQIQAPQTLSKLKTTLDINTLPKGNYILKISKDDQYFQNLNLIKN